jgi:hypothetical protein
VARAHRQLLCVTDPARYCSKAARALIAEMFGLSVTIVPQGCFLPQEVMAHPFCSQASCCSALENNIKVCCVLHLLYTA